MCEEVAKCDRQYVRQQAQLSHASTRKIDEPIEVTCKIDAGSVRCVCAVALLCSAVQCCGKELSVQCQILFTSTVHVTQCSPMDISVPYLLSGVPDGT